MLEATICSSLGKGLLSGRAKNMAYMLSVHLAAMKLNVLAGATDVTVRMHMYQTIRLVSRSHQMFIERFDIYPKMCG